MLIQKKKKLKIAEKKQKLTVKSRKKTVKNDFWGLVIFFGRVLWEVPRNRLPPRHHSAEKYAAIRTQINKLLELGVIEESQASEWSQAHPVPKSDGL